MNFTAKVFINGRTAISMRANGKMEIEMEKECSLIPMEKPTKASLKTI